MSQNSNFSTQGSFLAGFQPATLEQWRALFSQETKGNASSYPYADGGEAIKPFYTYGENQASAPANHFSSVSFPDRCRPVSVIDLDWDAEKIKSRLAVALAVDTGEIRCTTPVNLPLAQLLAVFDSLLPLVKKGIVLDAWLTLPQAQHLSKHLGLEKEGAKGAGRQIYTTVVEPAISALANSQTDAMGLRIPLFTNSLHEKVTDAPLQLAMIVAWARHFAHLFNGVSFLVQHPLGQDFILNLSKLRSQRMLFHTHLANVHFQLYGFSSDTNKSKEDPNTNLLRLTTEGLAALLGGADALLLASHDSLSFDTEDGLRLSLNIHQLLLHEAKLGYVRDPLRGTYVVEALSSALVNKAESWLGQIEAWGGIATATESGKIKEALEATDSKLA